MTYTRSTRPGVPAAANIFADEELTAGRALALTGAAARIPVAETLAGIRLENQRRHLEPFTRALWPAVEPRPYVGGWHLDAIAEHLEAVAAGDLRHLVINVPPRHSKSLMTSVFFPAWVWLRDAGSRFLCTSYSDNLAVRDSVKCRRVIDSPRYGELAAHCSEATGGRQGTFALRDDQNQKHRYDTDAGGYRIATTVLGANTGEGGDYIIIDDPHNIQHTRPGAGELRLEEVEFWWNEVIGTRMNDFRTSHFILIMQRCHQRDLAGHIGRTETSGDWTSLTLPARYEGRCVISFTLRARDARDDADEAAGRDLRREPSALGTRDRRTRVGELLCPERFPEEEQVKIERRLGAVGTAGQQQQRPVPRGGGMFDTTRFEYVRAVPGALVAELRYWDKAGTSGGGCHTAGVKEGLLADGRVIILDVVLGQWGSVEREKRIMATAQLDGPTCRVCTEQEPGSGGKESAEGTVRRLKGYVVESDKVTGSKEARAEPYAIQVEAGEVLVLLRDWTADFVKEHEDFPLGVARDQVDAAAGAFNKLTLGGKRVLDGSW